MGDLSQNLRQLNLKRAIQIGIKVETQLVETTIRWEQVQFLGKLQITFEVQARKEYKSSNTNFKVFKHFN